MPSLLKQNIHTSLANSFYADILTQRNLYYYFLGKTLPWGNQDIPPTINDDTIEAEAEIRNNIIFFKQIRSGDVSFVVRRIDWTSGNVYDRYDGNISANNPATSGAINIKDANFYVLTDDMNVYKCIHNNYGGKSTVKPINTSSDVFKTSDGYIWKFMYFIPPAIQHQFLTYKYMPVMTALTARYYDSLGINSVTIVDGGVGYSGEPTVTADIVGDGNGANISLSIDPNTGSIVKVRITSAGSGYTTATINIIALDDKGEGLYGNPTAILTPVLESGKLIGVVINDPGKNYSSNIQTSIVVNGTGQDAVLHPIVENGKIVDVIIGNPGYGYTQADLVVKGVQGSGAVLSVSTSIDNIDTIQSDVELLAIPGAVYVVDPISLGSNYTYAHCNISGDGIGLQITPIIKGNRVVEYTITDYGSGYTWCNIEVVGDGSGATCKAVLSPYHGHGHNAIEELHSTSITLNSSIQFEKNQGIVVNNDYRQFGIIKNPEKNADTSTYRNLTGSACYLVNTAENLQNIVNDDIFVLSDDSTKKFIAVAVGDTNNLLLQNLGGVNLKSGMKIKRVSDNLMLTIRYVTPPDIDKKSGSLLFVDNRNPTFQTENQSISLNTILKF